MEMTLSDLNYCILNENANRREKSNNLIRLAWFTAYFTRLEKLEPLKNYLEPINKSVKNKMSVDEAEKIYHKLCKTSGGDKNA